MAGPAFLFIAATTPMGSFFRLGRKWTREGAIVAVADWTDEQIKTLFDEPNLLTRPATEEEVEAGQSGAAPEDIEAATAALKLRVDEAIRSLKAEDFKSDGAPKVAAIQTLLEDDRKDVSKALVAEVHAAMVKDGFKVPEAG